jgi:chromosome partitioning protein
MTISVASYKGGVAKTTTSVHLAAYLNKHAGRTLLIDSDPNRQATFWASFGKLPFRVASEKEAVTIAREFDHFIFDTKARVEREEVEAISNASDLVVVPCPPDTLAAHAALQMIDDLNALKSNKYRVLLTMVQHDSYRDQCISVFEDRKVPYFRSVIRRYVAFQKAAANGVLVNEADDERAAVAWSGYDALGREIVRSYIRQDVMTTGRKEKRR